VPRVKIARSIDAISPAHDARKPATDHDIRQEAQMYRYLLCACGLIAALVASPASRLEPMQSRGLVTVTSEKLMKEISDWLVSDFDMPSIFERPAIEFVSDATLEELRHEHTVDPHASANVGASDKPVSSRSGTVALYDFGRRTIFLSESWTGTSPADQSVLVHEMVHHVQNMAEMKFECPMAREKLAYKAQNRWLARFGMNLESVFQIDSFTVLVNSTCM
jgi:hypothetical protein